MRPMKCMFVGDSQVGKTSLVLTAKTNVFPRYIPEEHQWGRYPCDLQVDGVKFKLIIKDGPEKPENAYLREFYCGYMDVIWLCFSVTDRESFENLYKKWYKGLRLSCPQAPIILVALKCDLRQNEQAVLEMNRAGGLLPISTEEGLEMSKKFKAAQYVECSAWSKIGMRRVFEEGIRAVYRSNRDFRLK